MSKVNLNIIQEIKSGKEKPLYDLYRLYRNEFLVFAQKNYRASEEQAKDCFQESVMDFHQNIVSGKLTELVSSEKTYLFQIGKHKILNLLKKEGRMTYHDNLQVIKGNELEDYMEEEEGKYTQEQITEAISKLPNDCQKILKLHYHNEYDMDSIARELGYKNSDTAKSKKSICIKKLIVELKKISLIFVF